MASVKGGVLLCEHRTQLVRLDTSFVNAYLKSGRFGNEGGILLLFGENVQFDPVSGTDGC